MHENLEKLKIILEKKVEIQGEEFDAKDAIEFALKFNRYIADAYQAKCFIVNSGLLNHFKDLYGKNKKKEVKMDPELLPLEIDNPTVKKIKKARK